MIHKGALQAVRICKIQYGLMRSKALDRSRERTAQGRAWSSVAWTALHFAAPEINSALFGTGGCNCFGHDRCNATVYDSFEG